jgi:hypothetical protein
MTRSEDRRKATGETLHGRATRVLSSAMILLGVLFLIRAASGGRVYAAVLGLLFLAAGSGRLYVLAHGRSRGRPGRGRGPGG